MNDNDIVYKNHFHIDNGGFTIYVDKFGAIKIRAESYGNLCTTLYLSNYRDYPSDPTPIDFFIKSLIEAKAKLLECET